MATVNDTHFYAACAKLSGMTAKRFFSLKKACGSAEGVWRAPISQMLACQIERKTAEAIAEARKTVDPERYYEGIRKEGIDVLCFDDERYPALLKEISPPPFALFYRGTLPDPNAMLLGIVGTRNVTSYGNHITPGIVSDLVQNGFGIVSGLCRGIDTIVHGACLERGGVAIAVLGAGVDDASIYPQRNRLLARHIIENKGCILSEYPPSTHVQAYHFPIRNRIISGLSRGVIIIECTIRSGTMTTARHALEQNRDVFAVPGPIYNPMSAGPHLLIKQGAIPLTSSADVCDHYNRSYAQPAQQRLLIGENNNEIILLNLLSQTPLAIDELCRMCDLDTRVVTSTLMVMEMKSMVRVIGGTKYVRSVK